MEYKTTNSSNVCKEGKSYRVRVMRNGIRVSKSFNRLKDALNFRNEVKSSN